MLAWLYIQDLRLCRTRAAESPRHDTDTDTCQPSRHGPSSDRHRWPSPHTHWPPWTVRKISVFSLYAARSVPCFKKPRFHFRNFRCDKFYWVFVIIIIIIIILFDSGSMAHKRKENLSFLKGYSGVFRFMWVLSYWDEHCQILSTSNKYPKITT